MVRYDVEKEAHALRVQVAGKADEALAAAQRRRAGYFQKHQGDWYLVNEAMPTMRDVGAKRDVPIGDHVRLVEGAQILLSQEDGGRLVQVQLVSG